jgi:hypothetical protein
MLVGQSSAPDTIRTYDLGFRNSGSEFSAEEPAILSEETLYPAAEKSPVPGLSHEIDPAESALAEALLRASRDGNHDLAMACVTELRARRLARESGGAGHVIDLDVERHRRQ